MMYVCMYLYLRPRMCVTYRIRKLCIFVVCVINYKLYMYYVFVYRLHTFEFCVYYLHVFRYVSCMFTHASVYVCICTYIYVMYPLEVCM